MISFYTIKKLICVFTFTLKSNMVFTRSLTKQGKSLRYHKLPSQVSEGEEVGR